MFTYTKEYSKNKCTFVKRTFLRNWTESIILDLLYHNEITEHFKVGHRRKWRCKVKFLGVSLWELETLKTLFH